MFYWFVVGVERNEAEAARLARVALDERGLQSIKAPACLNKLQLSIW
jgi:hypothetical protein